MMKQLINLVFSCTDREALNLAIFLNETFILLERWRVRSLHIVCTFYLLSAPAHHLGPMLVLFTKEHAKRAMWLLRGLIEAYRGLSAGTFAEQHHLSQVAIHMSYFFVYGESGERGVS